MLRNPFAADDVVKLDADAQRSLTGRSVKLFTLSKDRSHDRGGAVPVTPTAVPASLRADFNRRDGITAHVATGSPRVVSRAIAAQQVSAHPLLDELEQLIDGAWARHEAEHTGARAAQGPSTVVATRCQTP